MAWTGGAAQAAAAAAAAGAAAGSSIPWCMLCVVCTHTCSLWPPAAETAAMLTPRSLQGHARCCAIRCRTLSSLQACWASLPRICSTASSASSSPCSTSASVTTARCTRCSHRLCRPASAAPRTPPALCSPCHAGLPAQPCAGPRWPCPRASPPFCSRLFPPAPAVCGCGALHHQLQRGPVPRVPRPMAGHAAAGQRRVRMRGG